MNINQAGMSLIEILVAILISSILLQVSLEVYRNAIDAIDSIQSMQSVRHNVLLAMHALEEDIKYAGFSGCQTQHNAISGDSSSMMVSHMEVSMERLSEKMTSQVEMKIGKSVRLHQYDQIMISDCINTEIATVNKVYMRKSFQLINLTHTLKNIYSQNAVVSRYQKRYYTLDEDNHKLYYIDNFNNKIIVANDISALKIKYVKNHDKLLGIEIEYKFNHKAFSQTLFQFISLK